MENIYICIKNYVSMKYDYFTEYGWRFSEEDFLFYVKWKIQELINQGYDNQYILNFDDYQEWYDYAKGYLESEYFKLNKLR